MIHPLSGSTAGAKTVNFRHIAPALASQPPALDPNQMQFLSMQMPHSHINSLPSNQAIEDERDRFNELKALRDSHFALDQQLKELKEQTRGILGHLETERMDIFNHLRSEDDQCISRTIMFAQIRATKLLQGHGTEVGRKVEGVIQANSVVPVLLRSPSADCTLSDFQTLALHLLNAPAARCFAVPSEFHIKFPNLRNCSRLQVVFHNYADMCDAMQLDMSTREQAVYREKRNTAKHLQASQVIGSHVIRSSTRSIMIGCSHPTAQGTGSVPTLFQDSISWEDPTWECGLKFRNEPCSAFSGLPQNASRVDHQQQFSLIWERLQDFGGHIRRSYSIPGSLRSVFPAVVLRTDILTMSARGIFQNHVSSVTGVALKTMVATPGTSH